MPLVVKEVFCLRVSSCSFVFIRGSSSLTIGRCSSNDPHGVAGPGSRANGSFPKGARRLSEKSPARHFPTAPPASASPGSAGVPPASWSVPFSAMPCSLSSPHFSPGGVIMAPPWIFPFSAVLRATRPRAYAARANTVQREHVRAEGEKTSQGTPSTVCTLKTPNKAPQDVKDKHFSTLCSASW